MLLERPVAAHTVAPAAPPAPPQARHSWLSARVAQAALSVLAAVVALLLARAGGKAETDAAAAVVLVGVISIARRRPIALCLALILLGPYQEAFLAFLFHSGVPASLVRGLGFGKELLVIALVTLAVRVQGERANSRWDASVRVFLALGALYLVLPQVLPGLFDLSTTASRYAGWRSQSLGILAALAISRLSFSETQKRLFVRVFLLAAAVMAACAIWESLDPSGWNTFAVTNIDPSGYRGIVLGTGSLPGASVINHTFLAGHDTTRAGSFTFDSITLPFYLLGGLGLSFSRAVGEGGRLMWAVSLLLTGGILVSQTRSALFGLAVGFIVVLVRSRNASARTRAVLLLVIGIVLAVQLGLANYLVDRLNSAFSGTDVSTMGHQKNSDAALQLVLHHPAGLGWGVAPLNAGRGDGTVVVTAENAFLEIGLELGWAGLAAFGALVFSALSALARRAVLPVTRQLREGAIFALVSVCFAGFFLHVFEDLAISLTLWPLVGLALARTLETAPADPVAGALP